MVAAVRKIRTARRDSTARSHHRRQHHTHAPIPKPESVAHRLDPGRGSERSSDPIAPADGIDGQELGSLFVTFIGGCRAIATKTMAFSLIRTFPYRPNSQAWSRACPRAASSGHHPRRCRRSERTASNQRLGSAWWHRHRKLQRSRRNRPSAVNV